MGLAQFTPVGVGLLLGLGATQLGEQALRQPLHRHHRALSPRAQQRRWRCMAQDKELVAHQHQRRLSDEELTFRQGLIHPIGQRQHMSKTHLTLDGLQARLQFGHPSHKVEVGRLAQQLEPLSMGPLGQPGQQVRAVEQHELALGHLFRPVPMQPVDHLPVFGREEFGLVGRTGAQVAQVGDEALLLAGAGTEQEKMDGQAPLVGILVVPLRFTNDPQGRTR